MEYWNVGSKIRRSGIFTAKILVRGSRNQRNSDSEDATAKNSKGSKLIRICKGRV
jgi:hypothetical protein